MGQYKTWSQAVYTSSFDCLRFAKMEREGLGEFHHMICSTTIIYRHTFSQRLSDVRD